MHLENRVCKRFIEREDEGVSEVDVFNSRVLSSYSSIDLFHLFSCSNNCLAGVSQSQKTCGGGQRFFKNLYQMH